jgi:NADH-quinone oxidoreductase subunit N
MAELLALAPELLLLVGGVTALFAGGTEDSRHAAWVGAIASVAAAAAAAFIGPSGSLFSGLLELGNTAVFGRIAVAGLALVWLLWVAGRGMGEKRSREAVAFALFSALGGMLMIAARDIVVLFIALELSTMPAYVLMGYRREDERGLEGALKYFLLSMLTSLVMLYGLSFVYGISGSTSYSALSGVQGGLLQQLAFVFVLVGMFAKLSASPFHYWTPDAYAGAPASAVAFVSTVPKVAGTIALVQLVSALSGGGGEGMAVLAAAAVLSMVIGNLAAFPQSDLRRLMAYSGVAHSGYILLAVASGSAGAPAAVFYAVAYAVPSLAIMLLAAEEGTALEDLGGLVSRRPALAWVLVVLLLSLVGIPPMVGFFGKLYLFTSAVSAGLLWPVLIAVAMSVVSAGYYFRILRQAFFGERAEAPRVSGSLPASLAFGLAALVVLGLGVLASPVLAFLGVAF